MIDLKRASRGQALVETAIMLPLVIMCIVFLFWSGKQAVVSERLENTARYAEQVLNSVNDYNGYSLLSMYDMTVFNGAHVDNTNQLCTSAPVNNILTAKLSVGGQTDANGQATSSASYKSASAWTDQTVGTPTCTNGGVQVQGLTRPMLLAYSRELFTIQTHAPLGGWILFNESDGNIQSTSSHTTPQITAQTMVQIDSPTMQMMFSCYEEIHDAVVGSLWYASKGTGDLTPPWQGGGGPFNSLPPTAPPAITPDYRHHCD